MSYGADFATADPANAPLDPTIMIGADPFVWGAILLLILAALFAGYFFGARSRSHNADAAHSIWKAIHDAARSAMGADDNALKGKAEALLKVLDARLGKTMVLVGGVSESVDKLRHGVRGRRPHGGHGADDHGHGHAAGHDDSHHAGEPHKDGHLTHASPAVTIVNVNAGATAGHVTGDHPPGHPPAAGSADLTHREQTDLLRLAVAAFNEHWRDESARVGELRAAQAELSHPGSGRPPAGRISGTRAKH